MGQTPARRRRAGSATGRRPPFIRYEDVVAEPSPQLLRILAFLGRPSDVDPVFGSGTVDLPTDHHSIAGAGTVPGRPQQLRLDDESRRAMPAGTRRLVTALSAPMLLRYGYLPDSRRRSPS